MRCFLYYIPQTKWKIIEGVLRENGFEEFKLSTPTKGEEEELEHQLSSIRSLLEKSNCKVSLMSARDLLSLFPFFKTKEGYWVFPLAINDPQGRTVFILHNFDDKVKAKYKRVAELLYAIFHIE